MSRRRPFHFRAAAIAAFALSGFTARAELDIFGLGTGRDGALNVNVANTVINRYAQVTGSLAAGSTTITYGAAGGTGTFAAGDLVLIWKCAESTVPVGSAITGLTDLSASATGAWEFARVAAVAGAQLTLTNPLYRSYPAGGLQVVRVPEYTSVTLAAAGRIVASAWNGSYGGIVAFLATGTISNAGGINATGAGFRGGTYADDLNGTSGSTGLDLAPPGGAQKGEGIFTNVFGSGYAGRGAYSNGGGGAVAYKAGGAGGGNYGAGGYGGRSEGYSDGARLVGGYGGDSLRFDMLDHLILGGGGGAGHGSDGTGRDGGRGGGVIFIRANALTGASSLLATGTNASSTGFDGGSGGGAGGSIYVRFAGTAACGSVSASGAAGGSISTDLVGPGGGGGGGRILFQAASGATCNAVVAGGSSGTQSDPAAVDGMSYGAMPGRPGNVRTISGGLVVPATPVISSPAGTAIYSSTPTISGTTSPNAEVRIRIDSRPLVSVTADASGNYSYTVPGSDTLTKGRHTFSVYGYREGLYSPAAVQAAALPVALQQFTAQRATGGVALGWTLASEKGCTAYRPQRSFDGANFESLATIPAAGAETRSEYSYLDRDSRPHSSWYRLELVSTDGGLSYSPVRTIPGTDVRSMTLTPNPVAESARLQIQLDYPTSASISLCNELGLEVYAKTDLTLAAGTQDLLIPVHNLPSGVYSLSLRTAAGLQTIRMVVRH